MSAVAAELAATAATRIIAGIFARVGGRIGEIKLPEGALGRRTFGDWDLLMFANIDEVVRIEDLERSLRQFPDHRVAILLDTRRLGDDASFRTLTDKYPVYAVIELALAPRLQPQLRYPETPWLRETVASRLSAPSSLIEVRSAQTLGPYDLLIVAGGNSLEALADAIQNLGETRLRHLPPPVREVFPDASPDAHVFLELLTTFGPSIDPLVTPLPEESVRAVAEHLDTSIGHVGIPAVRLRGITGHFSCIASSIPSDLELFTREHWYWRPGVFECVLRPTEPLKEPSPDVFLETTRLLEALEPAANTHAAMEFFRSDTTWLFPLRTTDLQQAPLAVSGTAPPCCGLIFDGLNKDIAENGTTSGDPALDRLLDGFAVLSRDPLQASCVRSLRGPLALLRKWVLQNPPTASTRVHRGMSYHAREDIPRLLATLAEVMSERAAHTSHALRASVSFRFAGAAQKACLALEQAAREAIRVFVGPTAEIPQVVVHFEVCAEPRAITTPSGPNEAITIIEVPDTWLPDPSVFMWVIHNALHASRLPPADKVDWWTPLASTVASLIDREFALRCAEYGGSQVRAGYRDDVLAPAISQTLQEQAPKMSARQILTALQRRMAAPDDHVQLILALLADENPGTQRATIEAVTQLLEGCSALESVLAPVIDSFLEGLIDLRAGWLVGSQVYWPKLSNRLREQGGNRERCELLDYCWGRPATTPETTPTFPKLADLFVTVDRDHGTRVAPSKFQMPDVDKGEWLAWLLATWTPS